MLGLYSKFSLIALRKCYDIIHATISVKRYVA